MPQGMALSMSKRLFRHAEAFFRASKSSEKWGSSSCRTPFRVSRTHPSAPLTKGSPSFDRLKDPRPTAGGPFLTGIKRSWVRIFWRTRRIAGGARRSRRPRPRATGVGVSVPAPIWTGLRARYALLRFLLLPSRGGWRRPRRGGCRMELLLFSLPLTLPRRIRQRVAQRNARKEKQTKCVLAPR